jgi:ligand-binding sensor domain-containing protein
MHIRSLLVAGDGTLWIGTAEGLASLKDVKLTLYEPLAGEAVDALLEDRQGTVWAGGQAAPTARLCAIQKLNGIQCYGEDGSFGQQVNSLYEDGSGNLWVGALTGLWRWKPGPPKIYRMPAAVNGVQGLTESDGGGLLIAVSNEVRHLVGGKVKAYALPLFAEQFTPRDLLVDHTGGLWIGTTSQGLVHVHEGRTEVFGQSDGLSSNFIEKLFEDREGSVWVATLDGLDRFRAFAISTISVKQGLSNATIESVLAFTDGSVWLGSVDGLNRLDKGQITIYRKQRAQAQRGRRSVSQGLEQNWTTSSERYAPGTAREIVDPGLPDNSIESLFRDDQGQLWVSTHRGVAYLKNGRFTPVRAVPGEVHSIAGDSAGNLWMSQAGSLFHLVGGSVVERIPWATLGHQDGARALVADPLQGGV